MKNTLNVLGLFGIVLTLSACNKSSDTPASTATVSKSAVEARQTQKIANMELIHGILETRRDAAVIMNWQGEASDIPKGKSEVEHTEDLMKRSFSACRILADATEGLSKPLHNPASAVEQARQKTLDRKGELVDKYTDYIRGYSRVRAECEALEKEYTKLLDQANADPSVKSDKLHEIRYRYLYGDRARNLTAIDVLKHLLNWLRQEGDAETSK